MHFNDNFVCGLTQQRNPKKFYATNIDESKQEKIRSTFIFLKSINFFIGYNHKKYFLHYCENNKLRNKFVDRHIHVLHISQSAILSIYN